MDSGSAPTLTLKLRARPSTICPSEEELRMFIRHPEDLHAASFSHLVKGCDSCRRRLQYLLLFLEPRVGRRSRSERRGR